MTQRIRAALVAVGAALALASPGFGQGAVQLPAPNPSILYSLFERYLDALRQQTGIPGLSAVIVRHGTVDWERGFGFQDVEQNVPATPDTPYPVGSITQTLSAVMLGACAEQGQLDIDAPITEWVPDFPVPGATVRHLLAHASAAPPAFQFHYDTAQYAALTAVGQSCADKSFRLNMSESLLDRLAMVSSVPGEDLSDPAHPDRELFDEAHRARFDAALARQAVPYRVDRSGRASRNLRPAPGFSAADGLVSTARDLARFEAALADGVLLRPQSLREAWTPIMTGGTMLPTGLGWFIQPYESERLIWHFSLVPDAYSALILKMPARNLTLILLANSDGLSTGANLERGDVTNSPFVKVFLRLFG